jgi:class 3 adenylate cyclase
MLSNQTHGRAALSSGRTASTLARVTTCSRCGRESSGDAAFCPHCGAAQPAAPTRALEVRKTVTVLFCDVVGSTRLGEATDPETTRRVMSRYAQSMSEVITAYGGTVERFRGDEVMAVFGVPVVHEDDALRAVRAGMQMQRRLAELNVELLETWGIELACRIGINTGEVVAGDPGTGDTFVTGDAVNLGKRLEQAAQPGEILIGTTTYPLVKDAVRVGPRERFTAKGKSSAVDRFRLEEVDATAAGYARRLDAPLIGRADELRRLEAAIATLVGQSRCGVVGVTGQAGIGKSRLVRELVARLGDEVTVLGGRCLPYGAGIT